MKIKIIVLLIFLLLVGCSRGAVTPGAPELTTTATEAAPPLPTDTPLITPTPTPDITKGTVTIWHSWNEEQTALLDQILKDFSEQYPEVLLDVLYIPQENMLARLEAAYLDNTGPDILLGPAEWGPALYQAGEVADLSSLADNALLESINTAALQSAQYQGALIGLPYAQQGVVLYRNKALIDRAPTTLDDLINRAKSATQGEIVGAFLEQGFFFSGGHLFGLGGNFINPDGTPAFNDAFGLAWLELLKTFEQAGPTDNLTDQDLKLFKEGRLGWIIDGTWSIEDLTAALGSKTWLSIPGRPTKGKTCPVLSSRRIFTWARFPRRTIAKLPGNLPSIFSRNQHKPCYSRPD
jgi:maltose-binding protein MalE